MSGVPPLDILPSSSVDATVPRLPLGGPPHLLEDVMNARELVAVEILGSVGLIPKWCLENDSPCMLVYVESLYPPIANPIKLTETKVWFRVNELTPVEMDRWILADVERRLSE